MHMCYNRLAHNYRSMLWQAFGVPPCVAIYILTAIQLIDFFLQTSHGDSITTYGGKREKEEPFQELFQGNGAGPTGWVGVRYIILKHQR